VNNLTLVEERDEIREARASKSQELVSLGLSAPDDMHILAIARATAAVDVCLDRARRSRDHLARTISRFEKRATT